MGVEGTIYVKNDFVINLLFFQKGDKYYKNDVELVMQQTGCSYKKACVAMNKNDNDLVNAIMSLTPELDSQKCGNHDEKDIELVIQQSGCTHKQVCKALDQCDGDIVNAIMSLTN